MGGAIPFRSSLAFWARRKMARTTTLGRNGSDYTATLLARWLEADEVNIWTDVSGVMTADPGIVSDAYPLSRLSYSEALELVDFGASMFHSRTMIPLIESGIPMRIRNTLHPSAPGTLIDAVGAGESGEATSVTSLENLALLGVRMRRVAKQASLGGRVLGALEEAGLTVWMSTLAAHGQAVAVAVPMKEVARAHKVLTEELALEMERGEVEPVVERSEVTLLTLVAEAMGKSHNPAGRFFGALGAVGVPVRAIAQGASSRSISCVVDAADTAVAVRTVPCGVQLRPPEGLSDGVGQGGRGRPIAGAGPGRRGEAGQPARRAIERRGTGGQQSGSV